MNRLAKLDENLTVYPGHDYRKSEPSSLKTQKEKNPFLKFNSKEKFVQFLNDLKLGPAEWMKHVLHANTQCTRDPKAVAIPKDMPVCEVMGTLPAGLTCSSQNTQGSECGSSISATELKDRIDHHESMLLLDIREAEELISELGHMTDIKHIPLGQLPTRISELTPYKDETIISICRSGKRAVTAANFLEDNGFNKVVILTGGMIAWNQAGLPIQREPLATV
jgi:rhodanese-related sulfurtransferase